MNLTQLVTRPLSWIALGCIRCYQLFISPVLPRTCRFSPTCSEYTCRAINTHGFLYGMVLGIRRLFRCHPWGGSGVDPVPPVDGSTGVRHRPDHRHGE